MPFLFGYWLHIFFSILKYNPFFLLFYTHTHARTQACMLIEIGYIFFNRGLDQNTNETKMDFAFEGEVVELHIAVISRWLIYT